MTTDPWFIDNTHILLRLLCAVLLGGLIGWERERSSHAAGLRTHILVCVGSALIMLLSMYGFVAFIKEPSVRVDPARLATAVISGIGFLGAGTILFTGKSITGLTTAASLWVVAAIGLAVGAGFYFASMFTTLIVFLTLLVLNVVEQRYIRGHHTHVVTIRGRTGTGLMEKVSDLMKEKEVRVRKMEVHLKSEFPGSEPVESSASAAEITMHLASEKRMDASEMTHQLLQLEGVYSVAIE
ncbi:MgtC/SapB family protein [Saccharibacillus sp. CPCC 101409]|uniref:MgtC/SapB family protein n=1 Tax=Saccharibacillus sp. CPCC 101409 TaxID=3058041 RepID=UPI002671A496|nr:MgtC/SapB family protein [Saccharibacillus sp. CPCC 101409]MDO3412807.1 MgtC/SapB family protein [Saccharibacillus sp. CPCC 101409]